MSEIRHFDAVHRCRRELRWPATSPPAWRKRINTGSVDLATPNWASPDSKATVSVEDSTAQLHSNSRAAVKADPDKKETEIVMACGMPTCSAATESD